MAKNPERTGLLYANGKDYFKSAKDTESRAGFELQDGYSRVPHQDAPNPVAYYQSKTPLKEGGFKRGEKQYIYEKVEPKETPAAAAPVPEAAVEEKVVDTPIQLSDRAAIAKAGTSAYEDVFLPRQGDYSIQNDQSVIGDFNDNYQLNLAKERAPQPAAEQAYKDEYQAQLTDELKAKDPTTIATKKAEYELADKQKADLQDSYGLNLGNSIFS